MPPITAAHPEFRSHPCSAPAGANPQATPPAGTNPSPECAAILEERARLESNVRLYRKPHTVRRGPGADEFNARETAFYRERLADAVNELALFDLTRLTDEARARLTARGVPFTAPLAAAAE